MKIKIKKIFKFLLVAFGVSLVVFLFSFYNNRNNTELEYKVRTLFWKEYTNDYYHISLKIPYSWTIKEYPNKYGGTEFRLISKNGSVTIDSGVSPSRDETDASGKIIKSSRHIKQKLDSSEVLLGEYKVSRFRYINDFDEVSDNLSLYGIPYQKSISLNLNIIDNYNTNNELLLSILRTFKYTQKEPSLSDFVNYELPDGWTDYYSDNDDKELIFVSKDYQENLVPSITNGAQIRISRHYKDLDKPFDEQIYELGGNITISFEDMKNKATKVTVGKGTGTNVFSCWEGCLDNYFIENGNYIWQISFQCAPDCRTKETTELHPSSKDRDAFLKSFSFK